MFAQTEAHNLVSGLVALEVKSGMLSDTRWMDQETLDTAVQSISTELFHHADTVRMLDAGSLWVRRAPVYE